VRCGEFVQLQAESNQRHCGSSADPPTRPSTHSSWGRPPLFCDLSGAFATLQAESNQRHYGSSADPPTRSSTHPSRVWLPLSCTRLEWGFRNAAR
jgi:hypothetical protein